MKARLCKGKNSISNQMVGQGKNEGEEGRGEGGGERVEEEKT